MSASLTAFAYLVSGVCFIMALKGLSSPKTARMGNIYGISGMVIAILTTIALPGVTSLSAIVIGIAIGGAIGAIIALKIAMTALPQLVAAFHSLVGLAAVLVAGAAFFSPEAYGIGSVGNIHMGSLIEMSIGTAIGAITFTGSIIAFGKLQGLVTGKPLVFKGQHMVNLALGVALVVAVIWLAATEITECILGDCDLVPDHRCDTDPANRWRGYARCGVDAELLFGLGCSRDWVHAFQPGPHHCGCAGRVLGRDPQLHHVPGDEPFVLQCDPGRVWW